VPHKFITHTAIISTLSKAIIELGVIPGEAVAEKTLADIVRGSSSASDFQLSH
jgi:hypothetical protein